MDELTLTLPRKIRNEYKTAIEAAGGTYEAHPAEAVIDRMIDEFGREGRAAGKGFYDYDEKGARQRLWPGLVEHFGASDDIGRQDGDDDLLRDLQERMLFAEALETVKCLDEGVLTTYQDANIGSIFGIGFPVWTGGALQYVNHVGAAKFVQRADELARKYGPRFEPPKILRELASKGGALV